jgi:signal transduction histidine kinase
MKTLKNFFIPPFQTEPTAEADLNVILQRERARILTGMLRATAVLSTLNWFAVLPGLLRDERLDVAIFYTLLLAAVWFVALKLGLAYRLRASAFLSLVYTLEVIDLVKFGITPEVIILLAVFCILATILLGSRLGVMALFLSIVSMAVAGLLLKAGLSGFPITFVPFNPEEIFYLCVTFFVGVGLVMVGLTVLLNGFDLAWWQERRGKRPGQQESDLFEERGTERTQELVIARDQAREASHIKSQLLARVSHELRTPLGVILGYTELLQQGSYGPISLQQQTVMNDVIDSTHYLTRLVNELLDQAQFENDQLTLAMTSFTLAEIVQPLIAQLTPLAEAKDLALAFEIDPEMPTCLSGDARRLQQILFNLVSNAIKFTKIGTVQVHLYRSDSARWAIKVTDTGIGIPLEIQPYIFEPFRQGDGSLTRMYGGADLGLAIVKQLTALIEGEITLKSEVERGSTFIVTLPLHSVQENT